MSTDEQRGVVFPAAGDGRRSTAALGRAVVADALRPVDPAGALRRRAGDQLAVRLPGPLPPAGRGRAGVPAGRAGDRRGRPGLAARPDAGGHRGRRRDGPRRAGHRARRPSAGDGGGAGPGAAGEGAVAAVPRGAAARRRAGPPAGRLGDRRGGRAVRGRGGPHRAGQPGLAAAAATTPSRCSAPAPRWGRCRRCCAGAPGWPRSTCPGRRSGSGCSALAQAPARCCCRSRRRRRATAGPPAPAPTCSPRCRRWPTGSPGWPAALVLGNYVYADGATNVRVVGGRRRAHRPAAARPATTWRSAFLATPTDVFAVPADGGRAVGPRRTPSARWRAKLLGRPLRTLSAGRLLRRNYRARRRPRHQRQPGAAAGAELRAGQAAAAVAGGGRPGRRGHRLAERGAADPDPVGGEEPGARRRVRRGAPLRRRGRSSRPPPTC